ncbi:Uu.00g113340.m01.CDS01 [Anthostomella pinea]|uniref:Uu.00g113340.m01.CDS01 n=1 Tax=Anthostomella pinea TaxID=933095 RepID=A0AAI8VGE2_9PEZI|nr:Uu.00g113340.m01.CDS01 [Anthostomella pinea]
MDYSDSELGALQHQERHQESRSQPQYTTVGSIYRSQPQPLQPPTRRGRTVKSLYPYKNESPSAVHQYSPLQQNFDRAVSPNAHRPNSLSATTSFSDDQTGLIQSFGLHTSNMLSAHSVEAAADADGLSDKHDGANMPADGEEDSDNDVNLKQMGGMNIKSVTNLASYPNPMQKTAQKVLSMHRFQPAPVNALGSPSQLATYRFQQAAEPPKEQRALQGILRGARSDPVAMRGLLQSDSIDEYGDPRRSTRPQPEAIPWANFYRDPTYGTVLSTGPGAPAPLTAGPPGTRNYKPTALESAISHSTFRNSLQVPELETKGPMENPYMAGLRLQDTALAAARQPSPTAKSESTLPMQGALDADKTHPKLHDTLTREQAKRFYPKGMPPDFNDNTKPLDPNWQLDYPVEDKFWIQQRPEVWAARQAKIERDFYSGNDMINKSFSLAVSERNRRDVARALGSTYEEPEKSQGKVVNRHMTIEDAMAMPTCEHAAPLLSMAFQTLVNHPEFSPYSTLPKFGDLR